MMFYFSFHKFEKIKIEKTPDCFDFGFVFLFVYLYIVVFFFLLFFLRIKLKFVQKTLMIEQCIIKKTDDMREKITIFIITKKKTLCIFI